MSQYIVSARKYRPATFDSVVGQHSLTTTLKNAIATGRLAHAYLFCGPRGVGKTTCARIFAKTINCQHLTPQGEACNECESCRAFNEQRSLNIHELDAASNNGVGEIRQLVDQVRVPPQIGKYKVFIIDEVHMLSPAAFNAFLKTLEEPPAHAVFILATTEKHKILPTILSRCQIYDFNRMGTADIVNHLAYVAEQEGIKADAEALNIIAQKADGGMRDALSIFDQAVSYAGNKEITYQQVIQDLNVLDYEYYFRLTDDALNGKVSDMLLVFDDILHKGFDAPHFITGLSNHFRNLLVARDETTCKLLEASPAVCDRYRMQAGACPPRFVERAMKLCNDCDLNYRVSYNKRFLIELTLIRIAQLNDGGEGDDGEGVGRGPKKLKPLFRQAQSAAPQATGHEAPAAPQGTTSIQPPVSSHTLSADVPASPVVPAMSDGMPVAASAMPSARQAVQSAQPPRMPKGKPGFSIRQMQEQMHRTVQPHAGAPANAALSEYGENPSLAGEEAAAYRESGQALKPLEELDIQIHWRGFALSLPQEQKALQGRMLSIAPKLTDAEKGIFEVPADNSIAENDLKQIVSEAERYFFAHLHRPVKIQIVLRSDNEQHKMAMTQGERFRYMLEQSPPLQRLREELGLELG